MFELKSLGAVIFVFIQEIEPDDEDAWDEEAEEEAEEQNPDGGDEEVEVEVASEKPNETGPEENMKTEEKKSEESPASSEPGAKDPFVENKSGEETGQPNPTEVAQSVKATPDAQQKEPQATAETTTAATPKAATFETDSSSQAILRYVFLA